MIEINLLPEASPYAKERSRQAAAKRKQQITQILIASCIALVLLVGGGSYGYYQYQKAQERKADAAHQSEMRRKHQARLKAMEAEKAEAQRAEAARQRQERANMLNELTGKNFTTDQWDLLSEEERTALIRIGSQ